jgi:large subunit ribosomal protein L3
MKVLLAKKIGMTQVINSETGEAIPVTVLDVSNNKIVKHLKSMDKLTHIQFGKDKKKHSNKVDLGNYKEVGFVPKYKKTFKIEVVGEGLEINQDLKADVFESGDIVDIIGINKGKGFAGVMKRHNFKGDEQTHGQSDRARAPGSIGSGTTMGRVFKGLKMAGHMGNVKKTVKNLIIVDVDVENNLVTVSGSVPGSKNSYLIIKESFFNTIK